jgi:hypothetical protein
MADFIRFDGIDGENPPQADTPPNPPSWGLDRVDQRSLPMKNADPFFAYGESAAEDLGLSIIYPSDAPAPDSGLILVVTPILGPAAIGLMHADFIYM